MFKKITKARVCFLLEMLENIEKIIKRHGSVSKTLNDYEGQMAVLMGISQIGETLGKIDEKIATKYDLEIKGASATRNFIVHDYEGIDLKIVENILEKYLPLLKLQIQEIKSDFPKKDSL